MRVTSTLQQRRSPDPLAVLEVVHPITWFPPMWAFACGVVSSGVPIGDNWQLLMLGIFLSGPLVCGMSQAANDWCDREVDAINEPERPIPSGRIPGRWGLYIALGMTLVALVVGTMLGTWGFVATCFGVACAWAYSAEPLRLKRSGWWGPGVVGLCYEGLPWFTGAAIMVSTFPDSKVILAASLYAIGAHGIMTLNDFKALEGDRVTGIRSLPVTLGPAMAANLACLIMLTAQIAIVASLMIWSKPLHALAVSALIIAQLFAMRVLLKDPKGKAAWYNGTGVLFYISGMMITAFALRSLGGV